VTTAMIATRTSNAVVLVRGRERVMTITGLETP
jgi:hypothetical protein